MFLEILKYTMPGLLLIIGGAMGYFIQNRITRLQKIEENIRNQKFDVYKKLMDPYLLILSFPGDSSAIEVAKNELLSLPYKRNYYNLRFIGSDEVVKLHNELMKLGYNARRDNSDRVSEEQQKKIVNVLGKLFLEIRKEYGVKTKLKPEEIIEFALKELRESIDFSKSLYKK